MKNSQRASIRWAVVCLAGLMAVTTAPAEITSIKEALGVALKNETIAAAGDKMKLCSLSANYNGAVKRWSFQFYDGGEHIHTVNIDKSGKAQYYAREKGRLSIFNDLDWNKLPAPQEILIDELLSKAKKALTALEFETLDNGKIYMNYHVGSEHREKNKAYHAWSVTLPLAKSKQGKTVGFRNGKIESIITSTIYGG